MHRTVTIRIMLVEDHSLVRAGLKLLIESWPDMAVVAEAANREHALAAAQQEQPDVILLDLDLDGEDGIEFLPELLNLAPGARVLLLTANGEREQHRRAVRAGARGVVLKQQAANVLSKAIEKVHAGEVWLDGAMVSSLLTEMARPAEAPNINPEQLRIGSLSGREREVIALVCEGLQNQIIANRLSIAETTVRHHLTSIFDKLVVKNRLELVIYAYQHNLARPRGSAPTSPSTPRH